MSDSEKGAFGMEELAKDLPSPSGRAGDEMREPQRKEPTAEDFERYEDYVGQKWTGVCKWFNVTKGFGFIVPDFEEAKEQGDDVFVHQSSLKMPGFRSLDEGEEVEFTVRLGKRGLEAENVTGLAGAPIRGHRIHPLGKRKEKEIRCFNCGQYGRHKAAKCNRVPQNVKVCYICHSTDHLAVDCPNRSSRAGGGSGGDGAAGAGGTRQQPSTVAGAPTTRGRRQAGPAAPPPSSSSSAGTKKQQH